jgi:hypothetical protein
LATDTRGGTYEDAAMVALMSLVAYAFRDNPLP